MSATIRGAQIAQWGVPATASYGTGFITSSHTHDAEVVDKQILGNDGLTASDVDIEITNRKTYSLVRTSGTAPVAGDLLEVDSVNYRITSVSVKYGTDSEETLDVQCVKWAGITYA